MQHFTKFFKQKLVFNPLSPNIHIQILQTDLYISFKNELREFDLRSKHFSLVIILWILITSSLDNVWISLGENWCWSLLGLKGLITDLLLWVSLAKSIYYNNVFYYIDTSVLLENIPLVKFIKSTSGTWVVYFP